MSARGVTRKRRRPFGAGDFILGRRQASLPVVSRSLRLLHWVVHCVGYGLHHPDTTGERRPASPNLQSGSPQGHHGDPAIRRHFDAHWRQFFPTLPTRSVFAKHGANLTMLKRMVQRAPCPAAAGIDLSDSFSISVCTRCRVSRRHGPGRGAVSRLMRIRCRIETGQVARKILAYKMSLLFKQSSATFKLSKGGCAHYSRARRMMEMERRCFSPCPSPWARTCRTGVRSQGVGIRQPATKLPYRSLRKPAFR
jgi:hypothetical protein